MRDEDLATYMRELTIQGDFAQIAFRALMLAHEALREGPTTASDGVPVIRHLFAHAQSLLAAGAAVSKMLWCDPDNPRGALIRETLGITEPHLLQNRTVRNGYEHFDERLDRFIKSGQWALVDQNVGGPDPVQGVTPLRYWDVTTGTISVLNRKVGAQELRDAILDVALLALRWLEAHDPPRVDPPSV